MILPCIPERQSCCGTSTINGRRSAPPSSASQPVSARNLRSQAAGPSPRSWSICPGSRPRSRVSSRSVWLKRGSAGSARKRRRRRSLPTLDLARLVDRSYGVTASEAVQPQGGLDANAAWAALEATRQAFREAILSGDGLALGEVVHPRPHPVFGVLNLYQWVAFAGGHEARHTAQIREIAAAM